MFNKTQIKSFIDLLLYFQEEFLARQLGHMDLLVKSVSMQFGHYRELMGPVDTWSAEDKEMIASIIDTTWRK